MLQQALMSTIRVSDALKEALAQRKISARETYEEVIWELLEDHAELTEQTTRDLERAEEDVAAGRVCSLSALKDKYHLP